MRIFCYTGVPLSLSLVSSLSPSSLSLSISVSLALSLYLCISLTHSLCQVLGQDTPTEHPYTNRTFVGTITNFAESLNPVNLIENTQPSADKNWRAEAAVAQERLSSMTLERDALKQQVLLCLPWCNGRERRRPAGVSRRDVMR